MPRTKKKPKSKKKELPQQIYAAAIEPWDPSDEWTEEQNEAFDRMTKQVLKEWDEKIALMAERIKNGQNWKDIWQKPQGKKSSSS
jgi:hypothetical protein